ncbi:MAG: hypothetical protein RLZZ86_30 [Cyanobacteriota bacterium]|jgi:hypothetical protein
MASFNKFNQFVEDLAKGVHNFTSDSTCTVTVALTASAPISTNSVLADLTQISYTNLSSRVITGITAEQTSGTVSFTANDLVLTASGTVATFRYVVLYNDDPTSPADPLIGWYDYGANVTLQNGETFTIDFTTGFATLA